MQTEYTLISNLKGRVSKALSSSKSLQEKDRVILELLFSDIDHLLLSKRETKDITGFRAALSIRAKELNDSPKRYIQEHILPLVNKVSTESWRKK